MDKCTNDFFIAPIVITAKKDGSIKLALDAKPINAQIFKNKYQMPIVDELMDNVGQVISTASETEEVWFTKFSTTLSVSYPCQKKPVSTVILALLVGKPPELIDF